MCFIQNAMAPWQRRYAIYASSRSEMAADALAVCKPINVSNRWHYRSVAFSKWCKPLLRWLPLPEWPGVRERSAAQACVVYVYAWTRMYVCITDSQCACHAYIMDVRRNKCKREGTKVWNPAFMCTRGQRRRVIDTSVYILECMYVYRTCIYCIHG